MPCPLLQVKRCADAGADIVRITVQGKKEAEACMRIRERLFQDRCVGAGGWLLWWCGVLCGGCCRGWSRRAGGGCGCWQSLMCCLHCLTPRLPLPRSLPACRYDTPLVADIHFQPAVAMMVADAFEKIRINPGAGAGRGAAGLPPDSCDLRCSGY